MKNLSSDEAASITIFLNDCKSTGEVARIWECGNTIVQKYDKILGNMMEMFS